MPDGEYNWEDFAAACHGCIGPFIEKPTQELYIETGGFAQAECISTAFIIPCNQPLLPETTKLRFPVKIWLAGPIIFLALLP